MAIMSSETFARLRTNKRAYWHRAAWDSSDYNPNDASGRIFDGLANVTPSVASPPFDMTDAIFTMGSCFAAEIEKTLAARHCRVVSLPKAKGSSTSVRFTPRAMWQEFKHAFDELPQWNSTALVFPVGGEAVTDLNYFPLNGMARSAESVARDRGNMLTRVRSVAEARVVVLTLGFVESWFHKPTGLHCNFFDPRLLRKHADEFEFRIIDYPEAIECLEGIHDTIARHHGDGDFSVVVTVSPVPLQTTFSGEDIIVANARSKAILRAAADTFVRSRPNTYYFPSYEMAQLSDQRTAWYPDRVHVRPELVRHIVETFLSNYFRPPSA